MNPQTLFLIALPAGILALVAALGAARWNWRPDIPPFGRSHKAIHVLWHPEAYVNPGALPLIRLLAFVGAWLLFAGMGALFFQLLTGGR